MADTAESFKLGENRGYKEVIDCIADAAIAAGDPVKITGNLGEQPKVTKVTTTDDVFGVALNSAAADGEAVEVLLRGLVKLTAGGMIAVGKYLCIKAGKVNAPAASSGKTFGIAVTSAAADNDTFLAYIGVVGGPSAV